MLIAIYFHIFNKASYQSRSKQHYIKLFKQIFPIILIAFQIHIYQNALFFLLMISVIML